MTWKPRRPSSALAATLTSCALAASALAACGSSSPAPPLGRRGPVEADRAHRARLHRERELPGHLLGDRERLLRQAGNRPADHPLRETPAETLVAADAPTSASATRPRWSSTAPKACGTSRSPRSSRATPRRWPCSHPRRSRTPAQLSGKLYGGFGIASDKPIVGAIMPADGIARPAFREVVLNADVDAGALQPPHRLHGRIRRHRRRDRRTAGDKLRTFPYRTLLEQPATIPTPCSWPATRTSPSAAPHCAAH